MDAILKEVAIERIRFTCGQCGKIRTVDYDVQPVQDRHGRTLNYYSANGTPTVAPTAPAGARCHTCRSYRVHVELIAYRPVPLAPDKHDERLAEPAAQSLLSSRRESVPLLDGRYGDASRG